MNSSAFIIPTKGSEPAQEKEIDTQNLTEDDLKRLKQKDPFLYFSIPAVRSAALLNKHVDMSSLLILHRSSPSLLPKSLGGAAFSSSVTQTCS